MATKTENVVVARLSTEMYDHLVKQLPNPFVTKDTTELEAGFRLGIQHVLFLLREKGIVIPTAPTE